ncbi:cytochrome oxidase assembly protein ShyY1 [Tamaricihabitans halophyticus]|uniref:SURF1-like protein n=1 Tax=Tamaricihabitans halophyticus TaxID=1262583 RepID=A0A4R2QH89_9PSEU|nr:SURF1 family cytochrome oxidase biogenesis protein [Tamaricihabitans halophyticus]TCP48632.1 cytochrome oxidase assembly protein ShyY1 [Tamaricihabitans halophyticus]
MRWKFLLRPGWLGLTAVVFVFAAACYTMLAPWQFDRHDEQSTQNAALERSFEERPRPLTEILPNGTAPTTNEQWEQVRMTGRYLPDDEVVARLRTVDGGAAFEVLTPFQLTNGQYVLVNRGFVEPDGQSRIPDYAAAPRGQVELSARIRADENDPQNRPAFAEDGHQQVYAINADTVGQTTGLRINPGYLQLSAEQPGGLRPLPLPQLEAGPYFSYALQWIAFGTMAILGWGYFSWREARPGGALAEPKPRRKSVAEILAEDERAERAASEDTQTSDDPDRPPATAQAPSPS